MSSKRKQAQDSRNTAALDKASALQLDSALGGLSATSITVQGLFGKIGESLVTKHAELQSVVDAINLKVAELEGLHGKDKLLLSIDDLRVEFDKERDRLDEELKTILRDREQEEQTYQYNLAQQHKVANDQWDEIVRVRERDHKIKMEELDKKAAEREAAISAQEKAYAAAIEKLASFDETVKKEVEKQVSIVANTIKRDHGHQLEILNIQNAATLNSLKADNVRLQETLKANDTVITSLQRQLAEAQAAQTKLAGDAVAAAANKQGMADLQSLITNIGGPNGARAKS